MQQIKSMRVMVIVLFCLSLFTLTAYAEDDLSIKYDGQIYEYERFPKAFIDGIPMKNGAMPAFITTANRTLVPVREFCETLEGEVQWNPNTKEVYIVCQDNFIVLKIDEYIATVNGEDITMDETAKLVVNMAEPSQSKTMVPLRFLLEVLNYRVDWNQEDYIIYATKNEEVTPEPTEPKGSLDEEPIVFKDDSNVPDIEKGNTDIPYKKFGDTDITDVVFVNEKDGQLKFVISASSAISGVETTIWNNKLILDIANANKEFEEETVLMEEDNPYFKAIRSSQYSKEPLMTRIVLDMKYEDLNYSLKLTENRENIIVSVSRNYIHEIQVAADSQSEYAEITGTQMPVLNIFWLANPTRLVIDVPYSDSAFIYEEALAKGEFVKSVRTSTFNDDTARLVLELRKPAEFSVEQVSDETVRVRLQDPTYKNIAYKINNGVPQVIIKKEDAEIKKDSFKINDDYINKKATITIPYKNLDNYYGDGTIHINDDDVKAINLSSDSGGYHIQMQTKVIKGYTITEDDENYYINILHPQKAYDKVLLLDPGHGGSDPGKPKGPGNVSGMDEKVANLKICLEIYQMLASNPDIKVYMTRFNDTYPTLQERAQMANEVGADLFVSVHNNALSSSFNGTETLYYDTDGGITKSFANIMQTSTYTAIGTKNRGLKYRPDLYVLKHTKMPAVIVEVAFMTSPVDGPRLNDANFITASAKGIYNGILESYDMLKNRGLLK